MRLTSRLVAGGLLVAFVALCAAAAGAVSPHDPNEQDLLNILLPPAWAAGGDPAFPLGTDSLGRDTLARLLFGARTALTVAVVGACGAATLGAAFGHLAGYAGGAVDWLVGRAIEVWMSFPPVVLSLVLMVGLGVGIDQVILAIVLVDWTRFARVLRAEVVIVARRDYVTAARLSGYTPWMVVTREILPATAPLLITLMSVEMGVAVVVEAVLSFVGIGVGADTPAWGQMIADARRDAASAPWGVALPMAALFLTVAGFNLLGDGLRRSLDVRLALGRAA